MGGRQEAARSSSPGGDPEELLATRQLPDPPFPLPTATSPWSLLALVHRADSAIPPHRLLISSTLPWELAWGRGSLDLERTGSGLPVEAAADVGRGTIPRRGGGRSFRWFFGSAAPSCSHASCCWCSQAVASCLSSTIHSTLSCRSIAPSFWSLATAGVGGNC